MEINHNLFISNNTFRFLRNLCGMDIHSIKFVCLWLWQIVILVLICEVIEMEMIDKCPASDCFMYFISQFADPLNALKTVFLLHSPIKQNHFTNTVLGSPKSVWDQWYHFFGANLKRSAEERGFLSLPAFFNQKLKFYWEM